ncbi:MAG: hypothetical protein ABII82_00465 [Verrucomicrobiota bacterium]
MKTITTLRSRVLAQLRALNATRDKDRSPPVEINPPKRSGVISRKVRQRPSDHPRSWL